MAFCPEVLTGKANQTFFGEILSYQPISLFIMNLIRETIESVVKMKALIQFQD
jgi:hypothetical protein